MATVGAVRFGYGPAGRQDSGSAAGLMAQIQGVDAVAAAHPSPSFAEAFGLGTGYNERLSAFRKMSPETKTRAESGDREAKATIDRIQGDLKAARRDLRDGIALPLRAALARIADTSEPFRERLVWFWASHFAVAKRARWQSALPGAYVEEALRPYLAGPFGTLLKAAILHPMMLIYLDQTVSVGPNSKAGQKRKRGLNENLARELLELHTLGVGGGYSQADVRQLAEFLTGLSVTPTGQAVFRPNKAEPGEEHVLGRDWGGSNPGVADIEAFLDTLALHPDTARHLSRKLATHFIADDPPADMVDAMTAAYLGSGGRLDMTYAAMLDHPAAWVAEFPKARPPLEFVASGLRALGFSGAEIMEMPHRRLSRLAINPLVDMAQPFLSPFGPNGWPEEATAWITPQGLAARIAWAGQAVGLQPNADNDPDAFLVRALADNVGADLSWALDKSETRPEAVALVIASPEFNRR